MPWLELVVNSRYPEFAEELLIAAGAHAVIQSDGADEPVLEPLPGATPLWLHTLTAGLFDAAADLSRIREILTQSLPADDILHFLERQVGDEDWIRSWRQNAPVLHFGERLWICPSGHEVRAPEAAVVHLDPGLAFGTGSHPSTALCLDWLARFSLDGVRILDYGCGSGILAIAALRLGAQYAQATDIDEQALGAAFENARRNNVSHRLSIGNPESLVRSNAAFDVIVANILAKPLIDLAPKLSTYVTQNGHIVLAGILDRQVGEVCEAYGPWFRFEEPVTREGWTRLVGQRRLFTAER